MEFLVTLIAFIGMFLFAVVLGWSAGREYGHDEGYTLGRIIAQSIEDGDVTRN